MSQAPRPVGPQSNNAAPLRSEFATDPDMTEIVEMYVSEMPERVERLQTLWQQQQMDELKRLAHQLKGASGGYGFPVVGQAAGNLERTINQLAEGSGIVSLQQLKAEFEQLLTLCRRVSN